MNKDPNISFTFPYEWLSTKEGKKYFNKNVAQQVRKYSIVKPAEHPRLSRGNPLAFDVVVNQYGYKYKKFNLKREEIEKCFEDIFPSARLLNFETFFVQTQKLKTYCQMQIYY